MATPIRMRPPTVGVYNKTKIVGSTDFKIIWFVLEKCSPAGNLSSRRKTLVRRGLRRVVGPLRMLRGAGQRLALR